MRKLLKIILTVLMPFIFMAVSVDKFNVVTFQNFSDRSLHNIDIKTMPDGDRTYTIADTTYDKGLPDLRTDLLLSFNKRPEKYMKDDTLKYSVIYSEYYPYSKGDSLGGGCAMFFKNNHGVKLGTKAGLWLGSKEDLGSFTIEFRFRVKNRTGSGILFSRMSSFYGIDKGIEIRMNNGSVCARLHNIFKKGNGEWASSSYMMTKVPRTGRWYHYSLSFDRISGKIWVSLNGREVHSEYMTGTGNPFEDIYVPYFSHEDEKGSGHYMADLPVIKIGVGYNGSLDELRVSELSFEELKESRNVNTSFYRKADIPGRVPFNHEGVITSPVYSFDSTGTMVDSFSWTADLPEKTFVWAEFRIADRYFNKNDYSLKWYRVKNRQRGIFLKKDSSGDFLRGKYYQWRMHLVSSPDGEKSPYLKKVMVHFRSDTPPSIPMFPEIVSAESGKIVLRWKRNVDHDIAGYKIYYGTREGVYDGIIKTVNKLPITNKLAKGSYVQVEIDNKLIEENRSGDKRGVLKYPFLRDTVLYFFSVSAYDSYKSGTVYNHESKLSKTVTARPYGGSEIN